MTRQLTKTEKLNEVLNLLKSLKLLSAVERTNNSKIFMYRDSVDNIERLTRRGLDAFYDKKGNVVIQYD